MFDLKTINRMNDEESNRIQKEKYDNIKAALRGTTCFFSVTFYKKNGEIRKMVARTGVKKYVKGNYTGRNTTNFPMYITVFDVQKKAYRKINVRTVREIKMFHVTYSFDFPITVQGRMF